MPRATDYPLLHKFHLFFLPEFHQYYSLSCSLTLIFVECVLHTLTMPFFTSFIFFFLSYLLHHVPVAEKKKMIELSFFLRMVFSPFKYAGVVTPSLSSSADVSFIFSTVDLPLLICLFVSSEIFMQPNRERREKGEKAEIKGKSPRTVARGLLWWG